MNTIQKKDNNVNQENYPATAVLSIPGKVLAEVLLNKIRD